MRTYTAPVVSVIIPAYNCAAFIAEAIECVRAQTFHDHEIIVVDDGSTDQTADVLGRFPEVRRVRQANRGAAAARNAGIDLAAGEFVCFLDADDLWLPEKLARQVEFMAAHPDIGLLFCDAAEWSGDVVEKPSILASMAFGRDAGARAPVEDAFRKLLSENFIPTSTVMVRLSCFETAGLFDVGLPNAEDRDMWLRLAAYFPIACLPQVLARKRSHGANISLRTEMALRARIRVWQRCRRRFPALAPAAVYDQLFAVTYQQLAYLLLAKGEGRDARRFALASLEHAVRCVAGTASLFPYRWLLSLALLPLSFVRWSVVHAAWRARNTLLNRPMTSSSLGDGRPAGAR